MRIASVAIRGDGVAAYCCAHLLRKAGIPVEIEKLDRPRVPAIMLSDAAIALIRDVFEMPTLFARLPRIERRNVAWGMDASQRSLEHSAVVVSESVLLASLENPAPMKTDGEAQFTVHTSRPLPPAATEHRFGGRNALAARVTLKDPGDLAACWIESMENGWLFLIPNASESTWLLAVGAPIEALLDHSRIIAPRINVLGARSGEFSSCPRILAPLFGEGWLACGTAALGFDPICGDGTAHAVREAILASAVIRAIIDGGDAPSLLSHYENLLTAAMRRHLALCAKFYQTGGSGPWWETELEQNYEGFNWCTSRLSTAGETKYQLRGFDLIARG